MDVIRAIGQVPLDRDEKPRVSVTIVSCGELGKSKKSPADLHVQLEKKIADMNEEMAPTGAKVPEAVKARAILAGKQGGAPITESTASSSELGGRAAEGEEDGEGAATRPARNERERRLYELRLRMNKGRAANNKEVIEEQKREADPNYGKQRGGEERGQKRGRGKDKEEGEEDGTEELKPGQLPKGKGYLLDTMQQVEMKEA